MTANPAPDNQPSPSAAARANTLTCEQCVQFLLDYVDGTLPEAQRAAFDIHLAMCPDCVTYMANYRKAAELTRTLGTQDQPAGPVAAPDGLINAILRARKHGR